MKRFFFWMFLFLVGFSAVNLLVASETFQRFIFSRNPVSYFYIGYDWRLKLSRALLGLPAESIPFVGSSRTIYGADPRLQSSIANFGLLAGSQREINLLLRALEGANFPKLFLEANPVSLSHALIRNNTVAAKELSFHPFEKRFPLRAWLGLHLPLSRYRSPLALSWEKALQPAPEARSPEDEAKRAMHLEEYFWLDSHRELGFVPGRPPPGLASFLKESCLTMVGWIMKDENELDYGLLEEGLIAAKAAAREVVLWVPPASPELDFSRQISLMRALATKHGAHFLDLSKAFRGEEERLLLDCIHPNEEGAARLTRLLLP